METLDKETIKAARTLIGEEMYSLHQEYDIPLKDAWNIAAITVADIMGITRDELAEALSGPGRKSKLDKIAKTRQEVEEVNVPSKVPRARRVTEDPFANDDDARKISQDLKDADIFDTFEFLSSSHDEAVRVRGLLGKATHLAKWKGYQTRIVGSTLYVRRTR